MEVVMIDDKILKEDFDKFDSELADRVSELDPERVLVGFAGKIVRDDGAAGGGTVNVGTVYVAPSNYVVQPGKDGRLELKPGETSGVQIVAEVAQLLYTVKLMRSMQDEILHMVGQLCLICPEAQEMADNFSRGMVQDRLATLWRSPGKSN
jgi:hypothetical protein